MMKFEDYIKQAMNTPKMEVESVFVLEKVTIDELPDERLGHYPNYTVSTYFKYYCRTLTEAESLMYQDIDDSRRNSKDDIKMNVFCFYIKEYPYGMLIYDELDCCMSWRMYTCDGMLVDRNTCGGGGNMTGPFCRFRGRSNEQIRFKCGDIVEYKWGDEIILGTVVGVPPTIDEAFKIERRIVTGFRMLGQEKMLNRLTDEEILEMKGLDISDDCYTLKTIWNSETNIHANSMSVFAPHFLIPDSIKTKIQ